MLKSFFLLVTCFSLTICVSAQLTEKVYYFPFDEVNIDSTPKGWTWEGHGICKIVDSFYYKNTYIYPDTFTYAHPRSKRMLLLQKDSSNNPFGKLKTKIYPTCDMRYTEMGYFNYSDYNDYSYHPNLNVTYKGYTHKQPSMQVDSNYIYTQELYLDTFSYMLFLTGANCSDTSVKKANYDSIEIAFSMRYANDDYTFGSFALLDDVEFYFDTAIVNTGIDPLEKGKSLLIFPNPTTSSFIIEYTSSTKEDLSIYNILGEIVYKDNWPEGQTQKVIDLADFLKGIYLIKISNVIQKVIKE